jgi:peroxin-1
VPVKNIEDLDDLAAATEGYSGADLLAVLYNAHLAGIHEYIESRNEERNGSGESSREAEPPKYIEIGGEQNSAHKSLADKEALQKRVHYFLI